MLQRGLVHVGRGLGRPMVCVRQHDWHESTSRCHLLPRRRRVLTNDTSQTGVLTGAILTAGRLALTVPITTTLWFKLHPTMAFPEADGRTGPGQCQSIKTTPCWL